MWNIEIQNFVNLKNSFGSRNEIYFRNIFESLYAFFYEFANVLMFYNF